MITIFFIQNKKLIAINNNNKSVQRGAKVPDSTINGKKLSVSTLDYPFFLLVIVPSGYSVKAHSEVGF